MILRSTVSQSGYLTVCHSESVLYECFADGQSLRWSLSHIMSNQLFVRGDRTNDIRKFGHATLWLSNNVSLMSRLVLSYSPELNNSIVECAGQTDAKTLIYITAGTCD